jgi:hypothetical protein
VGKNSTNQAWWLVEKNGEIKFIFIDINYITVVTTYAELFVSQANKTDCNNYFKTF